MTNKTISKTIKESLLDTGKKLLKIYDSYDRREALLKSKHEIVTKADFFSEKLIIKTIKRNFPEHRILSEEAGLSENDKNKFEYLWIIDPIDGTTNFSMHNPIWCISVALTKYNKKKKTYESVLGFIYAPVTDEFYFAEKEKGAFLNGKKIKVSRKKKDKVLNTFCHGADEASIKKAVKYHAAQKLNGFDCRQMGSAALELAYVASGRIESLMIPGVKSWDVAAGALLVREAGGRVTDFDNKYWQTEKSDILASNGLVHNEILRVVRDLKK